jgi:transcriptional regulator with XRE-family HTH domain
MSKNLYRKARENSGITLSEAAAMLHLNTGALYSYEHGEAYPLASTIMHMAHLYKVSADYLIGNDCKNGN